MPDDTPASTPANQLEKKGRGPGKPFVKGDTRFQSMRERADGDDKGTEPLAETDLAALVRADMLHVYGRPKSADKTPGQKLYRRLMENEPKAFEARFVEMVRSQRQPARESGGPGPWTEDGPCPTCGMEPLPHDEGSERVEGLIDDLLRKMGCVP